MNDIFQLDRVSKRYGTSVVLEDISFSLQARHTVAVNGANGSGKSTLLRIIAGLSLPSSGKIKRGTHGKLNIGFAPERFPRLRLTPHEYLYSMGMIQGMAEKEVRERMSQLLTLFGLEEASHRRISTFSKGMMQKVNLMQAVLHPPDLLILDEPLSGLDAASQTELVQLLQQLKQQGLAIILTCHERRLLDELADRVMVLQRGKIVSDTLLERREERCFVIEFSLPGTEWANELRHLAGVVSLISHGHTHRLIIYSEHSDDALRAILNRNGTITALHAADKEQAARHSCADRERGQASCAST
ncbi:ATP-binding cassette domain-containing protein [Paenibacillus apiarius]|uniref:ABC transporter ATP-binding protein n=1 Tax=Paenibacillus apiarius TaxID=46240 RepID=A0ABT4DRB0_9BACL|nr:ABC transporter ATP-binding protein [Paenibacillus apiarius]MCY9512535.1 ABC transporter ATP-binding protein [Paenibacillus apiarius]MCY9519806.1 ABC transporter ATP-binding protein [Paenibacillus apiarius]MCY9553123.1 ABC transporter ATP-binding protein [Paenibacillus apiarius]MCY9559309.1 ABC transporter ATP-binding protein [Paenibacillus apiarius]MCY9682668.1 ABC transporter ATP-binding protein [Paenibacillus apiarius]